MSNLRTTFSKHFSSKVNIGLHQKLNNSTGSASELNIGKMAYFRRRGGKTNFLDEGKFYRTFSNDDGLNNSVRKQSLTEAALLNCDKPLCTGFYEQNDYGQPRNKERRFAVMEDELKNDMKVLSNVMIIQENLAPRPATGPFLNIGTGSTSGKISNHRSDSVDIVFDMYSKELYDESQEAKVRRNAVDQDELKSQIRLFKTVLREKLMLEHGLTYPGIALTLDDFNSDAW